jgi:hypothetical protein
MNLIPVFSTAILIATVASVILAVASYVAYKMREKRKPNRRFARGEVEEATFFHRYQKRTGTNG